MKMLLTSAGIKNRSIEAALLDLLGKPIAECDALCIPTASYAHPMSGAASAYKFIHGTLGLPMTELGWKSLGILELTALPSINRDLWVPQVQAADVLLVKGGDAMYLSHWMRESGLADLLPTLNIVWVGFSAGSMVMTPNIGKEFVNWPEQGSNDEALGIVDFAIFPHLDNEDLSDNNMDAAERWFASIRTPAYAIDNETAIKVVDGSVEVIAEGRWRYFDYPV